MTIKLPNGMVAVDVGDPANPVDLLNAVTGGISTAIGGLDNGTRQPLVFGVLSAAERNQIAAKQVAAGSPLIVGDACFQVSNNTYYIWRGSSWVEHSATVGQAFTPTFTNITVGNGVSTMRYHLGNGFLRVSGAFRVGSTTVIASTAHVSMTLPFPCRHAVANTGIGEFLIKRLSGVAHHGVLLHNGSNAALAYANKGSGGVGAGVLAPMYQTDFSPAVGTGAELYFKLMYPLATS